MEKLNQAELLLIAKGKHLDARVRWNPFGEKAREKQKAELREFMKIRIALRKVVKRA